MKNDSVTVNKNFEDLYLLIAPGTFYNLLQAHHRFPSPAPFALIDARRNGILVSGIRKRKRFPK
ncbi:hypothetical protein AWB74_06789 [Caballeronia arvi]|uniref:Uncharacterized protein n=1 Tax=Caballeronia arvi TaxID=1777135 RepID=A0A158KTF0_9BURK|nr:hypothetical protein AWB74_06789 [Caballeronia arvi]